MKTIASILLAITALSVQAFPDSEMVTSVNEQTGKVTIPDEIVLNLYELELIDLIAKFEGVPFAFPDGQLRDKVRISATASIYARMKAEDMVNRNYYGHSDKDGKKVFDYYSINCWKMENITLAYHGSEADIRSYYAGSINASNEIAEYLVGQLPMSPAEDAFWKFIFSKKGHSESLRGESAYFEGIGDIDHKSMDQIGVGVARDEWSYYVVVYFLGSSYSDTRKVYAPDGSDLTGRDAKTMGEAAGVRWASYGSANKWQSSIGNFVDVGGGFLLHDQLGMLYHDMNAVDRAFTLTSLEPFNGHIVYDEATRGTSNQGYNFYHSHYGWIWTDPNTYPYLWKRSTQSWLKVDGNEVVDVKANERRTWSASKATAPFVEMSFANWQVYQGDPVVLAWNSGKSPVSITANADGEIKTSTAGLHAWGWTADTTGEYWASITNQAGDELKKLLVVIPQPTVANLWIDAEPKVVKPNQPFWVAWSGLGDVPAQISGTSYGVFSNVPVGGQLFARSIPGKYHFTVRLGNFSKTVTVVVAE